jgi:HEPN domain-containing protein
MSLNYSSRIIADARITNVNGMRGLGVSTLRLNVEFRKTPWKDNEPQIGANVLWGTLSLRSDAGIASELGRAQPELPIFLAPTLDGGIAHQTFYIALSDAQLLAIEEARKGGSVDLKLNLVAMGYHPQYGQQAITDDIPYRANLSDWARILKELGHGDVIVLGVHLPIGEEAAPLRSAIEFLHQANRHLSNGEYDAVVARCRLAIESAQKILGDEAATRDAMSLYQKHRVSMSTLQREQMIREAVRNYTHLAHHVDNEGGVEQYGRSDATFLLTMAAAVITRAAARAPAL